MQIEGMVRGLPVRHLQPGMTGKVRVRKTARVRKEMQMFRRSRKHVLDWVSMEQGDFLGSLNDIIETTGARVTAQDRWMPRGLSHSEEARLDDLDDGWLAPEVRHEIAGWWLVHPERANTPNWDLLATCSFGNRLGLVLVEAKAHGNELKLDGKSLRADASLNSRENHAQIGAAIEEARQGLNTPAWNGFQITRDSHYQLANRMAFAWKLASLGVPTVLMYLGFVGDTGIPSAERPFMSEDEWTTAISAYAKGVLPDDYVSLALRDQAAMLFGGVPFAFVIRSRPILSPTT